MDIASLIGFVGAVTLIAAAIFLGSAPFRAFLDMPSVLTVVGGASMACLMAFPLRNMLQLPRVLKCAFLNRPPDVPRLIEMLVSLAETARRDGLLALESHVDEIDDPFITLGIQLAVDGTRAETIEEILRSEIEAAATRHREGRAILEQLARFAPAYGMIGTLMGLIMMLSNMSDPSGIGRGMAVALITTLYGALAANVAFQPLAEKLGFLSKQERIAKEIVVRGIMSIQSGENPRVIQQKLFTFISPSQRRRNAA